MTVRALVAGTREPAAYPSGGMEQHGHFGDRLAEAVERKRTQLVVGLERQEIDRPEQDLAQVADPRCLARARFGAPGGILLHGYDELRRQIYIRFGRSAPPAVRSVTTQTILARGAATGASSTGCSAE